MVPAMIKTTTAAVYYAANTSFDVITHLNHSRIFVLNVMLINSSKDMLNKEVLHAAGKRHSMHNKIYTYLTLYFCCKRILTKIIP